MHWQKAPAQKRQEAVQRGPRPYSPQWLRGGFRAASRRVRQCAPLCLEPVRPWADSPDCRER